MERNQIKRTIQSRFNRAASSYDQHCVIQNKIAHESLHLLLNHQQRFADIADFACGTGESTKQLIDQVSFERCYAIDFSKQLLSVAQRKLSAQQRIHWIDSDMESLIPFQQPLGLIFCNMGLQWSSDISSTLQLWRNYLSDHGLLLFSIPLAGNFPEIKMSYQPNLPSHQHIINLLSPLDWEVINSTITQFHQPLANATEALKHLKATGSNYNMKHIKNSHGLSRLGFNQVFQHKPIHRLTYHIGMYLAKKTT